MSKCKFIMFILLFHKETVDWWRCSSISKKILLFQKKLPTDLFSLHNAKEFAEYAVHTLLPNVFDKFFYDTARQKYNLRNVHLQYLSYIWWGLGINCKLH